MPKARHYASVVCLANQEMNHGKKGEMPGLELLLVETWKWTNPAGNKTTEQFSYHSHHCEGLHFLSSVAIMATVWVQSLVLCTHSLGHISQAQWSVLHSQPIACNIRSQHHNALVSWELNAITCLHFSAPAWAIQS